jgi:glycosyltransferase involved in cell wall biosynthesis
MIGQRGLPATYGGVERHVEELSTRLAARGHEVIVFCRRDYAEAAPDEVDGVHLSYPPTISSKHLEAFVHSGIAAALTVGQGFDIVHFHALGPGVWTPVPRFLTRARVVQTIHGLDYQRDKWGGPAKLVLRAGQTISRIVPDAVIVVGHYLLDLYRGRRHLTVHVPNGVTLPPRGNDSILDRLGIERGCYALFVGRLTPEKAVDQLIRAFRRVPGDHRLVVAGGSSFTDGYEAEIKALAAMDDRVILCGYVYGGDLAALYANTALYVQPSLVEGVPLTVLEAAAQGIPLVLSDIPAHREVVPSSRPGGRLFEAADEDSLALALSRALLAEATERSAAQLEAEAIRRRFSWDNAADLTESVYRQLVS